MKAATIEPKKIAVIAIINFILKPSNISWAVSVFLLFLVIYSFVFLKIQMHSVNRVLNSKSTAHSQNLIIFLDYVLLPLSAK